MKDTYPIERYLPNGELIESLKREYSWPSAAQDQIEYFVKVIEGEKENISGPEFHFNRLAFIEAAYKSVKINKYINPKIFKKHYAITGMGLKYRVHPLAIAIAYQVFKNLEIYLKIKRFFAQKIIKELKNKKGILLLPAFFDTQIKPSWYAFVFQYKPEDLDNVPIEKFFEALQAEGLSEVDRPGSTCPLNLLPLFQTPEELFPVYKKYHFSYKPGDFPKAEKFYQNAIKLPIWAFKKEARLVNLYIRGIKKVIKNYQNLL